MAAFMKNFTGGRFEIGYVSSHYYVSSHHNVAHLSWVLVQADGKVFAPGHDQLTVGCSGGAANQTFAYALIASIFNPSAA